MGKQEVDGLKNNLMGLPGITPHSEHIQGEISRSLGNLGEEYDIN